MADNLGVSQPTVSNWLHKAKRLPGEFVLRVETATGVSRHDLRPDLYPREAMVDHATAARFKGVDMGGAGRSVMQREAMR